MSKEREEVKEKIVVKMRQFENGLRLAVPMYLLNRFFGRTARAMSTTISELIDEMHEEGKIRAVFHPLSGGTYVVLPDVYEEFKYDTEVHKHIALYKQWAKEGKV